MTAKQQQKVLRRELRGLRKEYREEYKFLQPTADPYDLDLDPLLRRLMCQIDSKVRELNQLVFNR